MAFITRQRCGKYIYIREIQSVWDKQAQKQIKNTKIIGVIDPGTNEERYKQEYIDRIKAEGKDVSGMRPWSDRRLGARGLALDPLAHEKMVAQEVLTSVKHYGTMMFLRSISEQIGISGILKEVMPDVWSKVLLYSHFLIAENKAAMHLCEWKDENFSPDIGNMSSQRISELLESIQEKDRLNFYKMWQDNIAKDEAIALDITTITTESANLENAEIGRVKEGGYKLHGNVCTLAGIESRRPVFQMYYPGSLNDVSTLKTTLSRYCAITRAIDDPRTLMVMDKGFWSRKNAEAMETGACGRRIEFLTRVPLNTKLAVELAVSERLSMDDPANVVFTSGRPIMGVHRQKAWSGMLPDLHTYVFHDPVKYAADKNELYAKVKSLRIMASTSLEDASRQDGFKKYFLVDKGSLGSDIILNTERIKSELSTKGTFVLASNRLMHPQEAYRLYRGKDVIEKVFHQYKGNFGLDRFNVRSDEKVENKLLIAFIATVISVEIRHVIEDSGSKLTYDDVLKELRKIKVAKIENRTYIQTLTKKQRDLLDLFGVKLPDDIIM
jgi:transposase